MPCPHRQQWIYVLHFRMLVADSKQVFVQPPPGVRKIVSRRRRGSSAIKRIALHATAV